MTRTEATARVRRECARAGLARHVERCRHEHGLTQAQCAATLGISASRWGYLEDPDHKAAISVADVEALGEVYPDMARDLMARVVESLGLRVVDAEQASEVYDDMAAAGRVGALAGRVMGMLAEALADRLLDRGEAAALEPVLAELEAHTASLRARVGEAVASGVDAERRLTAVDGGAR